MEANGWSNLLFAGSGALLLFGAPLHWGAKTLSLIVGLALGAASVIALVDGDDVFGIFAANGLTTLIWGIAAGCCSARAAPPRRGSEDRHDDDLYRRRVRRQPRTVERERRANVGSHAGSRVADRVRPLQIGIRSRRLPV